MRLQRLLIFLTALGSIALLIGAALILSITLEAPDSDPIRLDAAAHPETLYVGADTCYTCHQEQELIWTQMLAPLAIQNPLGAPQAILASEQPPAPDAEEDQSGAPPAPQMATQAYHQRPALPALPALALREMREASFQPNNEARHTRTPLARQGGWHGHLIRHA